MSEWKGLAEGRALRDLAVVGLGELLWDLLPGGRQLGGAPANFAVMASRLGAHGMIASRIGNDELGHAALAYLADRPVDIRYLQTDAEHPTGSVSVTIENGQPHYVIHEPVAWDALELSPTWRELAGRADAICFGTLAQRNAVSQSTIHAFLKASRPECVRVYDVNFRAPFVTEEIVRASLAYATLLKLNDEEMPQILELLSLASGQAPAANATDAQREDYLLAGARLLLGHFPAHMVIMTLGPHGSLLVTRGEWARHRGIEARVVDTVGAGDAFTAAVTTYYLQGAPLAVLNEAGNTWGSWTAAQAGAMPALPDEVLQTLTQRILSTAG